MVDLGSGSLSGSSLGRDTASQEVGEILKAREAKFKHSMNREVAPLPQEALDWDERECFMWPLGSISKLMLKL